MINSREQHVVVVGGGLAGRASTVGCGSLKSWKYYVR